MKTAPLRNTHSFVRLDRTAVLDAFSLSITDTSLTAEQIKFIDRIVEHLSERGVMDPGLLHESPFTDIEPSGPEKTFNLERTKALIKMIDQFNESAAR